MPTFKYKAMDEAGTEMTGEFEAENVAVAYEYIEDSLDAIPIKVKEQKTNPVDDFLQQLQGVKRQELINYTAQLTTLLKAGVPLLGALDALREQTDNPVLKKAIEQIYRDVEAGSSYSDAIEKHDKIFPHLYVNTVRAGEAAGNLDVVLDNLVKQLERDEETQTKIKSALRYPLIVIVGMIAAMVVLVTYVIPKFASLFASGNAELPLPTQILIGLSEFFQAYLLYILIGAAVFGFLFYRWINTDAGSRAWDGIKLELPLFGKIIRLMSISRFAFILETLNKSGLPILESLSISGNTVGNKVIGRSIDQVADNVEKGKGLALPLKETKLFPPLVIQMIKVGEESGALDEMLSKVAAHYESEIEEITDSIMAVIQPIITIFMGVMVIIMALGVFLPMWGLMDAFQGAM
ncbi:MAG: type II secretion system F family protein [Candidatus Marinimicrobia bacterium]|nr:type II secretion system F family protein [Candidatus Neomarinimicrobiota bacterium]MCF7830171.1 type II secretion system F family protein [Candidatus Neomarinimicrobiota bacterium]MCF7882095.1 type II secretion system F family protein [Candidatus Neomarinimicrobiota bacterium]